MTPPTDAGKPTNLGRTRALMAENNVRAFVLHRIEDETGLSGEGVVAWGCLFPDGKAVTRWCGTTTDVRQTCVWDSIDHVIAVHGHDGRTEVVYL